MKYLRYITVALGKLLVKIYPYLPVVFALSMALFFYQHRNLNFNPYFYSFYIPLIHISIAFYFRAYSSNAVFNYSLQNGVYLKRLLERTITEEEDRYIIAPGHGTEGGYIMKRKVSWIEYQFVFYFLWGWMDNDSNHDTMSGHHREGMFYGNTFDIGDKRAEYPEFKFIESIAWFIRNTAYNFNYMLEECAKDSKYFFYHRFTTKYFDWHFGYIPYTNEKRQGRMVWFSEDIQHITIK